MFTLTASARRTMDHDLLHAARCLTPTEVPYIVRHFSIAGNGEASGPWVHPTSVPEGGTRIKVVWEGVPRERDLSIAHNITDDMA
jgi:hypothetical protein